MSAYTVVTLVKSIALSVVTALLLLVDAICWYPSPEVIVGNVVLPVYPNVPNPGGVTITPFWITYSQDQLICFHLLFWYIHASLFSHTPLTYCDTESG